MAKSCIETDHVKKWWAHLLNELPAMARQGKRIKIICTIEIKHKPERLEY